MPHRIRRYDLNQTRMARGTDQLETRRRRGQPPVDDPGAHLERAEPASVLP